MNLSYRSVRLSSACFGGCPNRKAEGDLVYKVGQVVNQVENAVLDTAHQISEKVAKRVDGPTNCHNEAHRRKGRLHMLVHAPAARASQPHLKRSRTGCSPNPTYRGRSPRKDRWSWTHQRNRMPTSQLCQSSGARTCPRPGWAALQEGSSRTQSSARGR